MNERTLKSLKKRLETERERLVGELKSLEDGNLNMSSRDQTGDLSGYSFHMADVATDNFDREFNLGLISNEQEYLNDISDALQRIENNEYGLCESCNGKIKIKRLTVMPQARMCIKCKQEEEDKKKGRR